MRKQEGNPFHSYCASDVTQYTYPLSYINIGGSTLAININNDSHHYN